MAARAGSRAEEDGALLLCDHASNAIPPEFSSLGLPEAMLARHVAWDPGALAVAKRMAEALGAPLVAATHSRLLADPNRRPDAPDLIVETAEGALVPGNAALDAAARADRLARFHAPFHSAIEAALAARPAALVSIHSFEPVMRDLPRPWRVGVIHGADRRLADPLIAALSREPGLVVGRNEPYSPADGVYYTLERHGAGRPTAMIEIRNDELRDEAGVAAWADRLAAALREALPAATRISA